MSSRGFQMHKGGEPALRLRPPAIAAASGITAVSNDRFKQSFWPTFRVTLLIGVAAHYAVFMAFPSLTAGAAEPAATATLALEAPPRVSMPEPPAPVARPARPRIAEVAIREQLTIAPTTFEAFDPREVAAAPAPPPVVSDGSDRPRYVAFLVPPRLKNAEETVRILQRVYPRTLKRAGIEGTVQLWIQIDDAGAVTDCQVEGTSGYPALDEAALTVAWAMEFVPAVTPTNEPKVWVKMPIVFNVI